MRYIHKDQLNRLQEALRQTIRTLEALDRDLPTTAEVLYYEVPRATDGLLDTLYETLRDPDASPQELFPVRDTVPALYSTERRELITAALAIESSGARLALITLNAVELIAQREQNVDNEITTLLKTVLSSVCTLSDFKFPTLPPVTGRSQELHFRVIVNDDLEYTVA